MQQGYMIVTMTMSDGEIVHHALRQEQHEAWSRSWNSSEPEAGRHAMDMLESIGKDFISLHNAESYVASMHATVIDRIQVQAR